MTRPDIEAIKARADAATEGPWVWHGEDDFQPMRLDSAEQIVLSCDFSMSGYGTRIDVWIELETLEDRAFIAHARTDIPDLLAYVAELSKERDDDVSAAYLLGKSDAHDRIVALEAQLADSAAHANSAFERIKELEIDRDEGIKAYSEELTLANARVKGLEQEVEQRRKCKGCGVDDALDYCTGCM